MKYKIKPHGCKNWTVSFGIWPFTFYLKNNNVYEWTEKTSFSKYEIYEYTFNSIEQAKDHLKTSIIFHGIKKAHNIQFQKKIKEHSKNKTIIVPPWK